MNLLIKEVFAYFGSGAGIIIIVMGWYIWRAKKNDKDHGLGILAPKKICIDDPKMDEILVNTRITRDTTRKTLDLHESGRRADGSYAWMVPDEIKTNQREILNVLQKIATLQSNSIFLLEKLLEASK